MKPVEPAGCGHISSKENPPRDCGGFRWFGWWLVTASGPLVDGLGFSSAEDSIPDPVRCFIQPTGSCSISQSPSSAGVNSPQSVS